MPTPTPIPVITDTGVVVTHAVSWMGDFATAISNNLLLVIAVVAVPLVGLGVGLLSRLLRKRV